MGHGYKSFADGFGQRVVDIAGQLLAPSGSSNQIAFGFLSSQDDFESAFSVDAEISGGFGGLSANARASLSKQYSRELTTVTIALTKQVVRGVYRIDKFPVDPEAATTASTPGTGASDYVRVYGDEVVTGVGVGGACCYVFKYVFSSEREASQFKASVGASYGPFGGSVTADTKSLMTNARASISLSGYSTGTISVPQLVAGNANLKDKNFVFSSNFSEGIMKKLLQFFDSFESHFVEDPTDSANSDRLGRYRPYLSCGGNRELLSRASPPGWGRREG